MQALVAAAENSSSPPPMAQEKVTAASVWVTGGCRSWYLDGAGRHLALWPDFTWAFASQTRRFDPASYEVEVPHAQ